MELLDHEQIQVNDSVVRQTYDGFGEVRQAAPAARFSATPSEISRPAPRLGEHSLAILAELGYDETRRGELLEAGVIATS